MSSSVILNPVVAAKRARQLGLFLPPYSPSNNQFPTLNKMGIMNAKVTLMGEQFLATMCKPWTSTTASTKRMGGGGRRVLEIGSAYGLLCLEALSRGGIYSYTAVELDERHLMIMAMLVCDYVSLEALPKLRLVHGSFPAGEGVMEALQSSGAPYDAIVADNVLHFLTEPEVRQAFNAFHALLKPGGFLFATVNTHYLGWIRDEVQADYLSKLEKWRSTNRSYLEELPLPGYVPRIFDALSEEVRAGADLSTENCADDPEMHCKAKLKEMRPKGILTAS